jgi:hypothetical protein
MSVYEEIKQERKKLKGQGLKAHLSYFWDYYKIHTLAAIVIIITLSVLIHDVATTKPFAFYAMMLNSNVSSAQEYYEESFAKYAGIDTTTYDCLIDTSASFHTQLFDDMTIASSQKIMANISAKELDVIAADLETVLYYANQDTFLDLRNIYSDSELEALGDRIIYVDQAYLDYLDSEEYQTYISTGEFDASNEYAVRADNFNKTLTYELESPDTMENPVPIALNLEGSAALAETGAYTGNTPAAALIINTTRPEAGKKFLEYLLK